MDSGARARCGHSDVSVCDATHHLQPSIEVCNRRSVVVSIAPSTLSVTTARCLGRAPAWNRQGEQEREQDGNKDKREAKRKKQPRHLTTTVTNTTTTTTTTTYNRGLVSLHFCHGSTAECHRICSLRICTYCVHSTGPHGAVSRILRDDVGHSEPSA